MHRTASLWALTLVSTLVVTVPATANELTDVSETSTETAVAASASSSSDALDIDVLDITKESPISANEETSTSEQASGENNPVSEELDSQGPVGPTSHVDVPTFETVRLPGQLIPSDMTTIIEDENVELLTFPDVDNFLALLEIKNTDAATEYRFENAIPSGHTAIMQPDGSIQFINSAGEHSGVIAAPWALDATGLSVPTRYELDGSTLVQVVEHHGASYPVIADPAWFVVLMYVAIYVDRCSKLHCVTVAVGTYRTIKILMEYEPTPRTRSAPNNTCNMRNRSGCN